jgi:teichuronic acid exporter
MLKRRALVATLWSSGDLLSRQGLQFLVTLVLARILTPADFGLVAMLALFVGLAGLLTDGGLSLALIQRQDIDHADESTVFWSNLAIGLFLSAVLFLSAPMLARFYAAPMVEPIAQLMSISPLLYASSAVHFAVLTRKLDFRTQARAGIVGSLSAGAITIWIAVEGGGVWAVALQPLLLSALTSGLLWCHHSWRPAPVFRWASLQKLGGFGGYVLAANVSELIYSRLYTLVAGRSFGAAALGHYSNAETTRQLPANFIGSVVSRIALPMLSRVNHDRDLVRRGVQLSVRAVTFVNAPTMLAISVLAEPIVLTLYGQQWLPAVSLLQVLAIAGVLYPVHLVNIQALLALGHARLVFRLELAKKALGVSLLILSVEYGLAGIAWSQVIFSIAVLAMNAHYTQRFIGYGLIAQLRCLASPLLVAVLSAFAMCVAAFLLVLESWIELLLAGSCGMLTYFSCLALLRVNVWRELRALQDRESDVIEKLDQ